jgi:subtilisin family serine protease
LSGEAPLSSFRYGDKKRGKTFHIVQAEDLFVVRSSVTLSDLKQVLSYNAIRFLDKIRLAFSFPEVKVNIFKIDEPEKLDACRSAFKENQAVKYAGRVWKEKLSGASLIYTENIFIKFRAKVPMKAISRLLMEYRLSIKEKFSFSENAYFLKAPEFTGIDIFEMAKKLGENEWVLICYPEMVFPKRIHQIHDQQWFLKGTSVDGDKRPRGVEMREVWHFSKGENVTIAVIDDGIDTDHPEFSLSGKVIFPRNTIVDLDTAAPQADDDNHGTCCAGVALAQGTGFASGVAPMARLIPIKSGGLGSFSEAKAFAWAVDHGADIISCSWGPPDGVWYDPDDPSHRIPFPLPDSSRLAIDYALKKGRNGLGCLLTWAAGNGNEEISFDGYASLPTVLPIAACDFMEKRAPYSDFGQNIACCFPSSSGSSDTFSPSDGIWTTDRSGTAGYNPVGNYVGSFGGTSAACPGAAGCLALILSVFPQLQNRHIRPLLNLTADKISFNEGSYKHGHSPFFGYGRINPFNAISLLKNALHVETEIEKNNKNKITNFRFLFNQPIFQLHLTCLLKSMDKRYPTGEWFAISGDKKLSDQWVFELTGEDASMFTLKVYIMDNEQDIQLKIVWK